MKNLKDLISELQFEGDISDLLMQYINARENNDDAEAESIKGMVASSLMHKGWPRQYTRQFLQSLLALKDERDVERVMATLGRDKNLKEESPIDPTYEYKGIITIPVIKKKHMKAEINNLRTFFRQKKIDLKKLNLNKSTTEYPDLTGGDGGKDQDPTVDIYVNVIFRTKIERDDLYDIFEPAYEVSSLDRGRIIKRGG